MKVGVGRWRESERQPDRQTDKGERESPIDRQTYRHRYIPIDQERDRQKREIDTDRCTGRQRERDTKNKHRLTDRKTGRRRKGDR